MNPKEPPPANLTGCSFNSSPAADLPERVEVRLGVWAHDDVNPPWFTFAPPRVWNGTTRFLVRVPVGWSLEPALHSGVALRSVYGTRLDAADVVRLASSNRQGFRILDRVSF